VESAVIRIIDANLNRLAEGLRTLEEIARLVLDNAALTQQLKTLRHDLIRGDLPFNLELLRSRAAQEDVGADLEVSGESKSKDLPLIVVANSRRAQESLRVLEEMAKLPEAVPGLDSDKFKQARFEVYTLEQTLVTRLLRRDKVKKVSGLYVIIDTQALGGRSHLEAARKVIEAGVKVIQFRDKESEKRQVLPIARELQSLCKEHDVLFIMNDYLDIALAAEADGLHIGQEDLPVKAARKLLPADKILGASAATPEEVREAEEGGADYIGVGCVFPTSSKDDVRLVGVERVRQIKAAARIPVAAIGGINISNTREVMEAGADSICVISAVLNAPDITRAAREIIEMIEAKK
jgi:thiamine-phosphate pyrophosphorylase